MRQSRRRGFSTIPGQLSETVSAASWTAGSRFISCPHLLWNRRPPSYHPEVARITTGKVSRGCWMVGTMLPDADESHFPPTLRSSSSPSLDLPSRWSLGTTTDRCHRWHDDDFLPLSPSLSCPHLHLSPLIHLSPRLSHRNFSLHLPPFVSPCTYQHITEFFIARQKGWPDSLSVGVRSTRWNRQRRFRVAGRLIVSLLWPASLAPRGALHRCDLWKKLYIRHAVIGAWLDLSAAFDHLNEVIVALHCGSARRLLEYRFFFLLTAKRYPWTIELLVT